MITVKIIAFCADVGQGEEELEGIKEKAIASGASECYVADLKEEYVKEYIYPIIKNWLGIRRSIFIRYVNGTTYYC